MITTNNNKMGTNISKKNNSNDVLANVFVDIPVEELKNLKKFFGLSGMKTAFLDLDNSRAKKYTIRKLDYAFSTGNCRRGFLIDIREFVADNYEAVKEFLEDQTAA